LPQWHGARGVVRRWRHIHGASPVPGAHPVCDGVSNPTEKKAREVFNRRDRAINERFLSRTEKKARNPHRHLPLLRR